LNPPNQEVQSKARFLTLDPSPNTKPTAKQQKLSEFDTDDLRIIVCAEKHPEIEDLSFGLSAQCMTIHEHF